MVLVSCCNRSFSFPTWNWITGNIWKRCVLLLPSVDAIVNLSRLLYVSAWHWHACLSIPSVCILQKPWLPPHTAQTWCVLQAFILHEKHFCCTIPLCHHSFSSDSNHRVEEIPQSVIKASSHQVFHVFFYIQSRVVLCLHLYLGNQRLSWWARHSCSLCRAGYGSNEGSHADFLHQQCMSEWASLW